MTTGKANSVTAVQSKDALWQELWVVAVDEAYNARDASRRLLEIQGMDRQAVVNVYFQYHPEMKEWAEAHVQNDTCEAGAHDLHVTLQKTRELRTANQERNSGESLETVQPANTWDWLAPFKSRSKIPQRDETDPDENSPATADPSLAVKQMASDDDVLQALRRIYAAAEFPPNLRQVWPMARDDLRDHGLTATKKRVQQAAEAAEFAKQRGDPGKHRERS